MKIPASELIINPDGSVYHLNLKPGEVSETIITVGDQDRVDRVASYFDSIELTVQKREFKTITGQYKGKRLTVISTGIGTDNIDIVFNELDALFNIDFDSREIKERLTSLNLIRIGTSGIIKKELEVDSLLISAAAIGTEGIYHFYEHKDSPELHPIAGDFGNIKPYYAKADQGLINFFKDDSIALGVTVTANGFYGPQLRALRLSPIQNDWLDRLQQQTFEGLPLTNLEMETAGIYALSTLLGHRAISINALLANRKLGTFSQDPEATEKKMILWTLDKLNQLV